MQRPLHCLCGTKDVTRMHAVAAEELGGGHEVFADGACDLWSISVRGRETCPQQGLGFGACRHRS
jgi:hypothetical protein